MPCFLCIACEHTGCFTSNGNLTSANYPNNYNPNSADSWLITAPAGQTVTIYFVDFYMEYSSTSCQFDYVILYDGDSASDPRIGDGKYCGTNSPGCLETYSNNLLVTFTSDHSAQFRGFSAKFYFGGQYE